MEAPNWPRDTLEMFGASRELVEAYVCGYDEEVVEILNDEETYLGTLEFEPYAHGKKVGDLWTGEIEATEVM